MAVLTLIAIFANIYYIRRSQSDYNDMIWVHIHSVDGSTNSIIKDICAQYSSILFEKFRATTRAFFVFLLLVCMSISVVLDSMFIVLVDYCQNPYELYALQFGLILVTTLFGEYVSSTVLHKCINMFHGEFCVPRFWGFVYLRSLLSLLVYLVAPVIATIFSSPSCFVTLFLSEDIDPEPYELKFCSLRDENLVCLEEVTDMIDLRVQAPFIYNNVCRNDLIEKFIPIFLFSTATSIMFLNARYFYFVSQKSPLTTVPHKLLTLFGSVYWPSEELKLPFRFVYSPTFISIQQNISMVILLTYGVLSPALSVSICIYLVILYAVNRHTVLRYIKECKNEANIKALDERCENSWLGTKSFANTTVVFSIIFHGLFLMDMSLDTFS